MLEKLRKYNEILFRPVVKLLCILKITPDFLTFSSLAGMCISGYFIIKGELLIGGIVFLIFSGLDFLDGMVSRAIKKESKFGAFLDSTIDRYSEAIIYLSLIVYAFQFREDYKEIIILSFVSFAGSVLTSYTKSRGENFIKSIKVGVFQRPERVVILGIGLIFNQLYIFLIILAVFTNITAVQRMIYVRKKLK